MAAQRGLTPRLLTMVTIYVDGYTLTETASQVGVSAETVKTAVQVTRRQLAAEGYTRLHTTIGLRRALRHRGNLDTLPPI